MKAIKNLGTFLKSAPIFFIAASLCGCQDKQLYSETRMIMGTFVEVKSEYKQAPQIVFAEIERIEKLLSKYDPQSEVSRLNQTGELRVSDETFYLIKRAKEFSRVSNGAFDISVAELLRIWGFQDKEFRKPEDEQINQLIERIGSDKIILHAESIMVKLLNSSAKIDLGAIAKGFAVDCAVKKLNENGISSCLINAGGDIFCLGRKFGKPWKIAIKEPRSENSHTLFELEDCAAATSGDYEQYFTLEGKRYAHIFNPRTGYPNDSGLASVTVTARDCLTADFLATAIMVTGEEEGRSLAGKFPGARIIKIIKAE